MRSFEIFERAAPEEGTFVGVKFTPEAKKALTQIQKDHKVPNPLRADEFHVTLVYSRKTIEWEANTDIDEEVTPTEWTIFDQRDGTKCLVLLIDSPYLHKRWKESMDMGATYDFPDYKPHITVSYNVPADFDYSGFPIPGPLELAKEYARKLRD